MTKAQTKDKILIIDDQPSVRFGLRSLLEGEGYRVLEAETGEPVTEWNSLLGIGRAEAARSLRFTG